MGRIVLIIISFSLLVAPVQAIELQGIGGAAGWSRVTGPVGNTYLLRLFADLGQVRPDLSFVPDVSRWGWSKTEADEETVRKSLFLNANFRYQIQSTRLEEIKPYVGGGLGLQSLTRETIQSGLSSSHPDIDLGLNLLAGGTYLINSRIRLCGEVRYTLVSAYSHLSLTAGAAYLLYD